jgi:hypothetical protein
MNENHARIGAPRKPESERRSQQLRGGFRTVEAAVLAEIAAENGIAPSVALRRLALNAMASYCSGERRWLAHQVELIDWSEHDRPRRRVA